MLVCPNDPDDVKLLSKAAGDKIDEVFIGSCMTNIGHFRAAGKVLDGQSDIPTRNFPNRLGIDTNVYLGSAALAAGCAMTVKIPSVAEFKEVADITCYPMGRRASEGHKQVK